MNRVELPKGPGSYRWYYVDATGGDYTAVFIFMVGSIFSPRYATSYRKGGEPREHAAVNFALYEKGARWVWVLSEYQDVQLDADGRGMSIGSSRFRYVHKNRLEIDITDRTAVWGTPTQVTLELEPLGPSHEPLRLVDGLGHFWHPIAPRAKARVSVPSHDLSFEAQAYHDGNHGPVPLGSDLRGWEWTRTQDEQSTRILYRPWHPDGPGAKSGLTVDVTDGKAVATRQLLEPPDVSRTAWGLQVPRSLGLDGPVDLLESSPFYARLESRRGDTHALGEVADFRRFHSPLIRWKAHFRTRVEAVP